MNTKTKKTANLFTQFFIGCVLISMMGCKKDSVISQNNTQPTIVAQAAAFTSTENFKEDIELSVFIPCANNGAGEFVLLTGPLHVLITFTINGNSVRGKDHFQPEGISGIGETTGDKYQATGVTQTEFSGTFINGQFEETDVNNFRIIGEGPGNNYLVHSTFHITFNANGVVTSFVDNFYMLHPGRYEYTMGFLKNRNVQYNNVKPRPGVKKYYIYLYKYLSKMVF